MKTQAWRETGEAPGGAAGAAGKGLRGSPLPSLTRTYP